MNRNSARAQHVFLVIAVGVICAGVAGLLWSRAQTHASASAAISRAQRSDASRQDAPPARADSSKPEPLATPAPDSPGATPENLVAPRDRARDAEVVAVRTVEIAGGWQRERLVRLRAAPEFLARVVDRFTRDAATGQLRFVQQDVMRADSVVVTVPDGTPATAIAARVRAAGFTTAPVSAGNAVVDVRFAAATLDTVPDALRALAAALPGARVEPNYLSFAQQTTPAEYERAIMWGLEAIEAPAAWTVSTGSNTVVVAVIDSGIDAAHPDLAANLWQNTGEIAGNNKDDDGNGFVDDRNGWNFVTSNATLTDTVGHGTHVAGTIGAVGNNGVGLTGVNWGVQLMALRAGDSAFASADLINALRYVNTMRQRGVHVVAVNASFGGSALGTNFTDELAKARDNGVLFVAAAGNDGADNDASPSYPASYNFENVVAVASCQQAGGLSDFSNFGATSVDLAAPGTGIFSTLPNATYGYNSGTSMAAPHVTGAVALVAAANPGLTAAQIRARLFASVDPLPALAGRVATGGRLNLRRAVAPTLLRPRVAITTPAARIVTMDRAGLALALAATLQPENNVTPAATLSWESIEGPAAVGFSTTIGPATVATFPTAGLYRVRVRAVAGALQETDELAIAVAGAAASSNGLRAWWRFDETSGAALDASGDARSGTLTETQRAGGVLGGGVSLNGTSSHIGFTAPTLSVLTMTAWAQATGAGNSIFPRVVHMRSGLLFLGLDPAGDDGNANTLKFSLDNGVEARVWHSPPGTIATGGWHHLAVTFDPTVQGGTPDLFIDGARQIVGVQPAGSAGTPSVAADQGFIGDRGDGTRNWQGALDEIRIFGRRLSAAEIAWLGHDVTLAALTGGSFAVGAPDGLGEFPISFTPATTGLAAPQIVAAQWSCDDPRLDLIAAGTSATAIAAESGSYVVRLNLTTADGVCAVRTITVTPQLGLVNRQGYYTGTTSAGGVITLVVEQNGAGAFFAETNGGHFRSGFVVSAAGEFSFTDLEGAAVSGRIDSAGNVAGLIGSSATFSADRITAGLGQAEPARDGIYRGWVLDSGIRAAALVQRGRVAMVVEESGSERAAEGAVNGNGSFALGPAPPASFQGEAGGNVIDVELTLPNRPVRRAVLLRDGYAPKRGLTGLSVRGLVGNGHEVLIPGFIVDGQGTLPVQVRGIGPGLESAGVTGVLRVPRLVLHDSAAAIASASLDSAAGGAVLTTAIAPGVYTAVVSGADGGTGVALADIYDVGSGNDAIRLIGLSGRGFVGTGHEILIGGFVVSGDAPVLVLIRGLGPGLSASVTGVLEQPALTVFRGSVAIAESGPWANNESAAVINAATAQLGLGQLAPNAADAALLLFLEPGPYTVHVRGATGATGVALLEVYYEPGGLVE